MINKSPQEELQNLQFLKFNLKLLQMEFLWAKFK